MILIKPQVQVHVSPRDLSIINNNSSLLIEGGSNNVNISTEKDRDENVLSTLKSKSKLLNRNIYDQSMLSEQRNESGDIKIKSPSLSPRNIKL